MSKSKRTSDGTLRAGGGEIGVVWFDKDGGLGSTVLFASSVHRLTADEVQARLREGNDRSRQ